MTQEQMIMSDRTRWIGVLSGICLMLYPSTSLAQISGDGTLGTQVNGLPISPCLGTCTIEGGTQRGVNLYHSFREFSIPTGGSAWFNNSPQIQTILTRVTGSSLSNIDGLIKTNGTTNLFFLNPNGILLGPNARLQIGGSFVASTASSWQLPDGSQFSAIAPNQPPLLTINVPIGLQPGRIPAGSTITNRGNLTAGQDVVLVGDRLDLQGGLQAGRDVRLQAQDTVQMRDSVSQPMVVTSGRDLTIQGNQSVDILTLNHPRSQIQSLGHLQLLSDGLIAGDAHFNSGGTFQVNSVSGQLANFTSRYDPIISSTNNIDIAANYTGASLLVESQESVRIQGSVTIDRPDTTSTFVGNDVVLSNQPGLIIRSGQTNLIYGGINQTNAPAFTNGTVLPGITLVGAVRVQPNAQGGLVRLMAANGGIRVASINTSSQISGGNGGDIELNAQGLITVTGAFFKEFEDTPIALGSFSESLGNTGSGGSITLISNNGNITVGNIDASTRNDGGFIAGGNGGRVSLTATNGNISVGSVKSSATGGLASISGNGGSISLSAMNGNITTGNLDSFSDSSAFGSGDGGSISLSAMNGNITTGNLTSFSFAYSPLRIGNGGSITLATRDGNITAGNIDSTSTSLLGRSANGGVISLVAAGGNIFVGTVDSFSYSPLQSGNGGDILLSARDGTVVGQASAIQSFSVARDGTAGNGGNITLLANTQVVGLELLTLSSSANSGAVQIRGFGDLAITNTQILTSKQVRLKIAQLFPGELILDVGRTGRSGNVTVTSQGNITLNNSSVQSDTKGLDPAGNVVIHSPGLIRFNNSRIVGNTSSAGQAGNITITAEEGINITGANSSLLAQTNSIGTAGNITLNTPTLTIGRNAQISATTLGRGKGGSVTLNVSNISLAGTVGVFAETQGQAPAGTLRLHPYQNQPDLNITLTLNSQISASTASSGNGGDLLLTAPRSITITGPGQLAVATRSTGHAGNVAITSPEVTLADRVEVSASSSNRGNAGDIRITANSLDLSTGARISSTTAGQGTAGNITVNVNDRLTILGEGTGLFAATTPSSTGNGGNIVIDPRTVLLQDGATIAVDSNGQGVGGNITLQAGRLQLRNQGSITAETASAQGGNITLNVQDLLLLRQNSLISATAGTAQAGGDGGNIIITSPFIIGVLGENSDITANAFTGSGGNINITSNAIYGLQFQPRLTPFSDITASSQFGLSGTVTLNLLNVDPSRGLVALPFTLVDPSQQIVQTCVPGSKLSSGQFVATGRGGIPLSPDEPLEPRYASPQWIPMPSDDQMVDVGFGSAQPTNLGKRVGFGCAQPTTRVLSAAEARLHLPSTDHQPTSLRSIAPVSPPTTIQAADRWIIGPDGVVELVASPAPDRPASHGIAPVTCQAQKNDH